MSYADAKDRLEAHRKAVEVAQQLLSNADAADVAAHEREYSIGQALYQLQEYAAASEHLLASYMVEERAETAARLAVCHWRMNELASAKQWIHRAIRLEPKGSITTLIARTKPTFLALLAQFHLSAGEVDEAASAAREALKLAPDDVAALYVLATTQLVAGEANAALGTFDSAIEAAPPFVAKQLAGEQRSARNLKEANVRLQPFVTDLKAFPRVIL
jgi:tetratricopeptide (TPR) repeat protein